MYTEYMPSESSQYLLQHDRRAMFEELLGKLQAPRKELIFISGPEGIGKSSLLERVGAELMRQSYFVISGSRQADFAQVLRSLTLQLRWTDSPLPEDELHEHSVELFNEVSADMPVLIVFDDVHKLSFSVLDQLVRFVLALPGEVRFLATVDSALNPSIYDYIDSQSFSLYNLRRVPRSNLADYLSEAFDDRETFSKAELNDIHSASAGIPARINEQASLIVRLRRKAAAPVTAGTGSYSRTDSPTPRKETAIARVQQASAHRITPQAGRAATHFTAPQALHRRSLTVSGGVALLAVLAYLNLSSGPVLHPDNTYIIPDARLATAYDTSQETTQTLSYSESWHSVSNPSVSADLSADERHLLRLAPETFAIQFSAGQSQEAMERFVEQYSELGMKQYRGQANGEALFKAVVAGFADSEAAALALASAPHRLQESKPWVRKLASVQKEIRETQQAAAIQPSETRWLSYFRPTNY